jgi:TRAP-type C4-dicarboxylate transport system permease small subunit
MTYAAAVGLTRDGANVRVELFVAMLGPRGQARIQWLCDFLCLVFAAVAAWLGARYVMESASFGISFAHSDLPFPIWVAQATIPICFSLMTFRLLLRLVGVRPEQPVGSVEA